MDRLLVATFGFPAVVFTFLLVVVLGYWVLVALGVSDVDAVGAADPEAFGLGRVPLSVALSVATALAWTVCLAGDVLFGDNSPSPALPGVVLLVVALLVASIGTRLSIGLLSRLFPESPDLTGRPCVVRTGRVDRSFGEAEVDMDGTHVVVQVRQEGDRPLRAGSAAVVGDYDRVGRFFWITAR
ncbi:hypothetical protein [Actinokineospora enzanensis]|uniref:hypothetical protein n=1 Tax=Actinokineospora enzanensis TaxID=155975 RepID=UPI00036D636B|nr:hypothetical protein [Actinokineospora enzanensis]